MITIPYQIPDCAITSLKHASLLACRQANDIMPKRKLSRKRSKFVLFGFLVEDGAGEVPAVRPSVTLCASSWSLAMAVTSANLSSMPFSLVATQSRNELRLSSVSSQPWTSTCQRHQVRGMVSTCQRQEVRGHSASVRGTRSRVQSARARGGRSRDSQQAASTSTCQRHQIRGTASKLPYFRVWTPNNEIKPDALDQRNGGWLQDLSPQNISLESLVSPGASGW